MSDFERESFWRRNITRRRLLGVVVAVGGLSIIKSTLDHSGLAEQNAIREETEVRKIPKEEIGKFLQENIAPLDQEFFQKYFGNPRSSYIKADHQDNPKKSSHLYTITIPRDLLSSSEVEVLHTIPKDPKENELRRITFFCDQEGILRKGNRFSFYGKKSLEKLAARTFVNPPVNWQMRTIYGHDNKIIDYNDGIIGMVEDENTLKYYTLDSRAAATLLVISKKHSKPVTP